MSSDSQVRSSSESIVDCDGITPTIPSSSLHDETELPGELVPEETHKVIFSRYHFAAHLARDKRVLEVGCGPAIGMALLSRYARLLVGAEYSAENIRIAQQYYGHSQRIVRADAHKLPFPGQSFDLILAMAMVYYLNFDSFLREVTRILQPGGSLFFCVSNKDVPGFVPAPHTTQYYSVPELSKKLEEHDMTAEFLGVFPASGNIARRRVRAVVKNAAKSIVCSIPGGQQFWLRMRASTLGPHMALPDEIAEDPSCIPKVSPIRSDEVNRLHRVVYVVARL